jgi:signal transduction histidine kinase
MVEAGKSAQPQARPRPANVALQWSQPPNAAASCAGWIRAAAGADAATVRVALLDNAGRLRIVASEGTHDASGRLRSRRRRSVLLTGRPALQPVQGSSGISLGMYPLEDDGDRFGVVEVLAPSQTIEARHEVLMALGRHAGTVLSNARMRKEAGRELAGKNALLGLASDLLWARTATEALRDAIRVCHQHLGRPAVGLLPDRDGWGWFLAASGGLGARRRARLKAALRAPNGATRRPRIASLRARFRDVGGFGDVLSVRAGAAVILVADASADEDEFIGGVVSLVESVLPRLGVDGIRPAAGRANEIGIAWTAHELKGPLLGASAALDRAVQTTSSEGRELMRRTRDELQQLSDLIDPLLRWSTGNARLLRQRVDLVEVTREAVASTMFLPHAKQISVDTPDVLCVMGDHQQLRSAIANVVRNALIYAPLETEVNVRVEAFDGSARVVVRDRGPGIPEDEREAVFDPLSRGRSSSGHQGVGLGLFIARRVLEAHGGSISLRPTKSGATFVLEVPTERWHLSVS